MRYLIIGYGNIGQKREAILGKNCVAVVDPVHPGAHFNNFKDVPFSEYDAAVLATPNSVKLEILEYLIKNKKNVLVEKPLLFPDFAVADKLDQISKKNKVIWYTSYNHRFEPLIVKIKENLDSNLIGEIFFANFIYGNGTVQNTIGTWRDEGGGVLDDLGGHLIDLAGLLFQKEINYRIITAHNYEAKQIDHCSFSSTDGKMTFTCSYLMWKNTFNIDIYGSKGSIHLDGLNKWGSTSLTHRERIFPSGVPLEKNESTLGSDETWRDDFLYFEKMVSEQKNSLENDIMISKSIDTIMSMKNI